MKVFMLSLVMLIGVSFIGNAEVNAGPCNDDCNLMRETMYEGLEVSVENNQLIQEYYSNCMHCCTGYGNCWSD